MFVGGIAFVCFYDAERVLYAITKFLFHLLEEGKRRGDVGAGRDIREETGEGMKSGKLECTKK